MEFKSERLIFREYNEEDFQLFYSIFSNEQIMKYAYMDKVGQEEELLPYFNRILQNNHTSEGRPSYEFGVFLSSSGQFIGFADVEMVKRNRDGGNGEIGYFLLPDFWGQGYATEIINRLLKICFEEMNLHRVFARCNANNLNSEKVMIKAGMEKEGRFRKVRYKNGSWDDELQYSILIEEYKPL
ncbi:ribosomal-protein-alanine N-acetyltransferase [Paenibacillus uliginis N3/975]|uniref:Ribosomal-protein-alanine N-acetyltransferase n=1 Tax=Paenibacillus uliginis N3/975 TaxID=1313296 RepID=A0A1X7HJ56_9BACL|nr:GNAT family protein [Paenibacillus uliginis]SMF86840.1 ribosomal-protein-alanine N-acetyltransferase [Paenibacillus uliginis N3/975]